ncbi:cupin domain-containing protein [Actinoallomurus vinaceus]|uniref:Cupin domain-containing protein n=1 Tax=Actinoallomurus vinaceus TaxID=1080074 RepID=A0ABP8U5X9_9ACTN
MRKLSLDAVSREQLERAVAGSAGRSATTVYGGHERALRQTVVALKAGSTMDEHVSPGEGTVHVLRGRVRLLADGDSWEGRTGDLIAVPDGRHSLEALEDSAILLTVVKPREGA